MLAKFAKFGNMGKLPSTSRQFCRYRASWELDDVVLSPALLDDKENVVEGLDDDIAS